MPESLSSAPLHLAGAVAVVAPALVAAGRDTFPLARRNEPQWREVSRFLVRQLVKPRRVVGLSAVPRGAVRTIPDGNHGDNLE